MYRTPISASLPRLPQVHVRWLDVSVDDALLVGRLDLVSGAGQGLRLFYSVPKLSERFDLWLNLNGAMEGLDEWERRASYRM